MHAIDKRSVTLAAGVCASVLTGLFVTGCAHDESRVVEYRYSPPPSGTYERYEYTPTSRGYIERYESR